MGEPVQALVGQHHWPVWGNARVRDYVAIQRDLYKHVHDQTVRLMNQGLVASEIAEKLRSKTGFTRTARWRRDFDGKAATTSSLTRNFPPRLSTMSAP